MKIYLVHQDYFLFYHEGRFFEEHLKYCQEC